jgi:hypothetical protein
MAKISLSSVKALFQTGDRPTQENYVDLIDTASAQATDLGSAGSNEDTNEITVTGIENSTLFDSFSATEWRSIKYVVSLKKNSGDKFFTTELTIVPDGTNDNVSEYGTVDNNGNIGTINVSRTGSTVSLTVVPVSGQTPITLRYMRTGLKA